MAPILIIFLCILGVFLLTHPGILNGPVGGVVPVPDLQPQITPPPTANDEIRARYGDKYIGYEHLIKRTSSGGFDTREADVALAGLPVTAPPTTVSVVEIPARNTILPPGTGEREIENYIYRYTNEERQSKGISALSMNSCLSEAARAHSADMAVKGYFSHTNLQGQDPSARASVHGCPIWKPVGGGMSMIGIGENIGKMPTGNVVGHGYVSDSPQSVGRAQMDSWMGSTGHRANILNPLYSSIGVGVSRDASGYYISTQDFL